MRLHEFTTPEQLDELDLKKALATGALAAAAVGAPYLASKYASSPVEPIAAATKQAVKPAATVQELASAITGKYKVDPKLAMHVAQLAKKHEKPVFPRAEDILALIGIESSFNPHAVSGLRRDPALGLTQVRPRVWGMKPTELRGNLDKQVAMAAHILDLYNQKLNSPESALHAYNMGITAFRQGKTNPRYVQKFKNERNLYM